MERITISFPDQDSLWQFKNQTQAINVAITPKKNMISGLFQQQDVELAVNQFNAVTVNKAKTISAINKGDARKTGQDWFKIYFINYDGGIKKLKKVVSSIQSLKFF